MATPSKTARAAMKAGMQPKKAAEVIPPVEMIRQLRDLRKAKLFVTNMEFVDALLAEFDAAVKTANIAAEEVGRVTKSLHSAMNEILRLKEEAVERLEAQADALEELPAPTDETQTLSQEEL